MNSNSTRDKIFNAIPKRGIRMFKLSQAAGVPQILTRYHVGILESAGMVRVVHKDYTAMVYPINKPAEEAK